MRIAFLIDPPESFKIYKDSTFAMMREAASRGHTLWACEPQQLVWQRGGVVTAPSHRRKGLGAKVVRAALAAAGEPSGEDQVAQYFTKARTGTRKLTVVAKQPQRAA